MKSAAADVVGRTITGIVVKESKRGHPDTQLFLLLHDGSYYEFYSDGGITGAGGRDPGGLTAVLAYMCDADRWPTFGHVANPTENARLQCQVALGRIVRELRSRAINQPALIWAVAVARDAGFDHAELYSQALEYRPSEWESPPTLEDVVKRAASEPRRLP